MPKTQAEVEALAKAAARLGDPSIRVHRQANANPSTPMVVYLHGAELGNVSEGVGQTILELRKAARARLKLEAAENILRKKADAALGGLGYSRVTED